MMVNKTEAVPTLVYSISRPFGSFNLKQHRKSIAASFITFQTIAAVLSLQAVFYLHSWHRLFRTA